MGLIVAEQAHERGPREERCHAVALLRANTADFDTIRYTKPPRQGTQLSLVWSPPNDLEAGIRPLIQNSGHGSDHPVMPLVPLEPADRHDERSVVLGVLTTRASRQLRPVRDDDESLSGKP
jgi:hypothetical protein